jgi:hypothetical protein
MALQPQFLWHNAVHETWADERLVFLFLAYEPTYNRDVALKRLREVFEQLRICSYQIYETTAPYDLLVRAWVPKRMQRHELYQHLNEQDTNRRIALNLSVEDVVHHWPWRSSRGAKIGDMLTPSGDVLTTALPIRELEQLNALQCNGTNGASNGHTHLSRRCRGDHIITKPTYRSGIRFLVLVKVRELNQWELLQHRIIALLDEARAVIRDPSLYRLDDQHQFLIFGHVDETPGKFHAISRRLVSHINDYAASGGARTYSVFFAIRGFLDFRDELRLPEAGVATQEVPGTELLQRQEGQRFEIKGSAFTDLHQWIVGGDVPVAAKRPATDTRNKAVNALVRAIASLLNSDGGHVVIGALERSKYGEYERFQQMPAADKQGIHRCCGLRFDCPDEDWDAFARKLREVIDARFEPKPARRWLKIRIEEAYGERLCIIDITEPDEWFWAKVATRGGAGTRDGASSKQTGRAGLQPKFFVRVDGATRELKGREIDEHKRSHPRRAS